MAVLRNQDRSTLWSSAELALFDSVARYFKELKATGEGITPKQWKAEVSEQFAKADQPKYKEEHDR
ncbi:MAG: hypothetical protein PHE02_12225 [Lachnospiraceae bacterium]|nr:hypothetical protein [Lachnospiraceae bacterium]